MTRPISKTAEDAIAATVPTLSPDGTVAPAAESPVCLSLFDSEPDCCTAPEAVPEPADNTNVHVLPSEFRT